MTRPTVFISYSHRDEIWKNRLMPHLGVLEQTGRVDIWDDRWIGAGAKWYDEIRRVMGRAAVAVCLISADYLASDFINKEEIPYLLECRERKGMVLIPVLLRPCPWKAVPWLEATQMLPRDGKSVSRNFRNNWDVVFAEVAERIFDIVGTPDYQPPAQPPPRWSPPEKVDIRRLPVTGAELFGRQRELELLDEAWESDQTNIVSLVAWGGVGKSALLNHWLANLARDHYRGARRVYGWSFYSQGTGERVISADLFISEALTWFGDLDPTTGSPLSQGERLADLVRREKTLLLLDGLESLQLDYDYERGKVKDAALGILITELARDNPGLCIITTRQRVADIEHYSQSTAPLIELEHLSDAAGAELLRALGVQGPDEELQQAAREFGGHGLALNLLGTYLRDVCAGDVRRRNEVSLLEEDVARGGHAQRVMASYEKWLGADPELAVLRLLGLYDRPADGASLAALRAAPAIAGLTDALVSLDERRWQRALARLRQARLLASADPHDPETLDAHPLVREHFGAQLQQTYPDAWREGNNRLYEYFKATAKEFPDTLEEMAPLFAAVAHGCAAGRHQETLEDVYVQRIRRGNESFITSALSAFGLDIAILSGFFDLPWRRPVAGLSEDAQAAVLGWAGFDLRALGRLAEAAQPLQAALKANTAREDWENAARAAGNLSELYLTLGDLAAALETAEQSVALANRSGDAFMRMVSRTTLADALHQAGRLDEAVAAFEEAEALQKERQPEYPLLYSLRGFHYCDLLLNQGEHQAVQERAEKFFEWCVSSDSLLDIALDHLSLGRAHLLAVQVGDGDFSQAAQHLDQAVDGLRQAGTQDHLPRGLLARAALHRAQGAFERAQRDLDEALSIAERGGMRLHEADCYLEYVRLYLALGERKKAREHCATTREMITEMGLHRRDDELAKLEGMV